LGDFLFLKLTFSLFIEMMKIDFNLFFMATLIFDIETIGEDFASLDQTTQESLTRWIKKESSDEGAYRVALEELKAEMGFSPLTGEIIIIGVLDADKNKGAVYFQAPGEKIADFEEDGIKFKQMTEKEMLEKFWEGARQYQEFVSFNGRTFDIPFLMVRSAIQGIRPTKNLMSNRYVNSQADSAKSIDLLDQLNFYGAMRKKGSLHLWTRAFGIKSPKEGISGDEVAEYYKKKKYIELAKYNTGDLFATKELYNYWQKYLKF
jgi:hypothetical protein